MNRPFRTLSSFFSLLLVLGMQVGCGSAAAQGPDEPQGADEDTEFLVGVAPETVRRAMQAGEYGVALRELERLEEVDARGADAWIYLQAVAHELGGDVELALGTLERMEREHGESAWMHKSRLRRAELLKGLRRFPEAEAIYEQESTRLRSGERKAELAAIYLRFADERSAPEDASSPVPHTPNYGEAIVLYQAVLDLDAPRAQRDHALYRIAECLRLTGNQGGAFEAYGAYVEAFDPTGAGVGGVVVLAGAHFLEARLKQAEGALALGRASDARRGFQGLVELHREYSGDVEAWGAVDPRAEDGGYGAAFERLAGDAARKIAATWERSVPAQAVMGMAAIERYVAEFPAHAGVPSAAFDLGAWAAKIGRHVDALDAYDAFLGSEPHAQASAETAQEHARLSMQALFRKGALLHSQGRFEESITVLRDYVRTYPNGPDWAGAQASIVHSEHRRAEVLREAGEHETARVAFLEFLAEHPLEARAPATYEVLGQLFAEEARELEEVDGDAAVVEALFAEALAQWRRVAAKYPGREESSLALFRIAQVLEDDLDRLEDAVDAYRDVRHGSYQGGARAKLLEMTVEALGIRSPRAWRSTEEARIVAQVRNVKELEVKVHQLDLEAYFVKHLTHQSISELDLDLIPADHEFTYEVEDYEDFAALEREIVLPVEGPGAWAVVVSAGEKRATTLVLRSDVDLIVKSSRREVFLWAEDMAAGVPAAGVRVLVGVPGPRGDGDGATLYNLQTGTDGTARLEFDELREAGELRILAVRDGHFASNSLGLGGLALAQGLAPRGLVYTDRSAYQRGELVSWKAIVRTVAGGAYAIPEGVEHLVEIIDARGRTIAQTRALPNEYGTLHGEHLLAAAAPQGHYSITCKAANGALLRGAFLVEEYQLDRLSLEVELERGVYFRGETVEMGVRAVWYYGEPLVGAPVQLHLPDGRVVERVTDGEGFASAVLETVEFPERRRLEFRAVLLEEGVSAMKVAQLAVRGFALRAAVERDVVLAGAQVGVSLRAIAPDGEPLDATITAELRVLERVSERGSWSERLVETRLVEIARGGEGRERELFSLSAGGSYIVRLSAEDRFGNPISAEDTFVVSGDEDEVSLRVLAQRQQVDVGEEVTVQLVNRGAAALALLTLEGERVLEHHLVPLTEGVQEFSFQVQSNHYPSVTLGLAVMRTGEFDVASAGFEVARRLEVSVEVSKAEAVPGERVEIVLVVVDQLGNPVAAELSVAVVDEAIFAFEPDSTPAVQAVFSQGARRPSELRTVSTCAFSYEGVGSTISAAILQEELRVNALAFRAQSLERTRGVFAGLEAVTMTGAADFEEAFRDLTLTDGSGVPGMAFDEQSFNEISGIGGGGGAGGRFGRRAGGRSRVSKGQAADARDRELLRKSATALWIAALETGSDGRALVEMDAPESSTRWRVVVRGVGVGHLFGDARASFQTRSAFFCELAVPQVMMEGDRVRPILRVHNATGAAGAAEVTLRVRIGGEVRNEKVALALGLGVTEHVFSLSERLEAGVVVFEVDCEAALGEPSYEAGAREVSQVLVPGVAVAASRAGVLTSAETIRLTLPKGSRRDGRELSVHLGGGREQVLVDALLIPASPVGRSLSGVATASTASELIGLCALVESMRSEGRREEPRMLALMEAARKRIGSLVAMQRSDGGWPWVVGGGVSHSAPSARCVWALADARDLGMDVPSGVTDKGAQYLNGVLLSASQDEDERKAMVLHALAELRRGSFGPANRLHRVRASLSPAALAYTALALAAMDRAPMAADVSRTLAGRYEPAPGGMKCGVGGNTAWSASSLEMTALALLAHERAGVAGEANAQLGEHLMAERPWFPARARGVVVAALARRAVGSAVAGRVLDVDVAVGDGLAQTVRIGADGVGRELVFEIPAGADEKVVVRLDAQGRGDVHYELVLRGVHSAAKDVDHARFEVTGRERYALAPRYRGRAMQTGFGVLSRERDTWSNKRSDVRRGEGIRETITFSRDWRRRDPDRNVDWFVAEIPLPAGAEIMEGSLSFRGSYHHEIVDGRLIAYIGQAHNGFQVSYTLLGAIPGEYHMAPVVLRSVNDPGAMAYAEAATITVLDRDEATADTYRPTPDELFHLGKAMYEHGESDGARARLSELYASSGARLHAGPLKELAKMMLYLSIAGDDSNEIVRFFEVLKERDPALVIPFDEVVRVAEAYRELEEYERALLIFRAIVEETFSKDLKVVGTLEAHGEFLGATEVMERLYMEFPDLPVVKSAFLALSDMFLKKAPEAISDPRLRAAGMNEIVLKMRGILLLRRFLATHSADPLAPDAALNLVTAYISLEDYERASALAGEMAALYTEPEYADSFGYSRAVSEWYLGNDSAALELLDTIARAEYSEADGSTHASENRDLALYILAQIHHARQEVGDAVAYYGRVEDVFADAKHALLGLQHQSISMEEVTHVAPGERVELVLKHRNIDQVELLVYEVDLMTLYLRERSLADIRGVKLAGIAPVLSKKVSLEVAQLRPGSETIALDVDGAGAYLVMCRGAEQFVSGLVLVSDLDLDVREDAAAGVVRVEAVSHSGGEYLRAVDVRVVGQGSDDFFAGETDLRGLYIAEGVAGVPTVIARLDGGHYAFHRGDARSWGAVQSANSQKLGSHEQLDKAGRTIDYFQNISASNSLKQADRGGRWYRESQKEQNGLQIQQVQ